MLPTDIADTDFIERSPHSVILSGVRRMPQEVEGPHQPASYHESIDF